MNKPFLLVLTICGALAGCVSAADKAEDSGWVNLFNGKNLDGWEQHGGKARYRFEDGQLIGTCVSNTPNSFLCTRSAGIFIVLPFHSNSVGLSKTWLRICTPEFRPEGVLKSTSRMKLV